MAFYISIENYYIVSYIATTTYVANYNFITHFLSVADFDFHWH